MKRDLDLVRDILLAIERDEKMDGLHWFIFDGPEDLGIGNCPVEKLSYTIGLMAQAGFLKTAAGSTLMPAISGLTWERHDFLGAIRDDKIWAKTKQGALAAGGFTFDLLKDLAEGFIKKQIEERTGVQL
jgi:Hypothetical protein (DUF2513)